MTEEKKFELDKRLGELLGFNRYGKSLGERIGTTGNEQDVELRDQIRSFYNNAHALGHAPYDGNAVGESSPLQLKDGLTAVGKAVSDDLESKIEPAFSDLKSKMKVLDAPREASDEVKAQLAQVKDSMYLSLLGEGVMPKELEKDAKPEEIQTYKDLQYVKATVDFAKRLKTLSAKGNYEASLDAVNEYARATGRKTVDMLTENDMAHLAIARRGAAPVFRDSERQVFEAIANAQLSHGIATLREKKLYGAIDKAVDQTKYGKTRAFEQMYGAYQMANGVLEEAAKKSTKAKE